MSRPGCVGLMVVVSPTYQPALEEVAKELMRRHPTWTLDQVREMILVRGIVGLIDDYNMPRIDSNRDEDA